MHAILLRTLLALCAIFPAAADAGVFPLDGQPEFLEARDVFRVEVADADEGIVRMRATIPPGYYIYRHRLRLEAAGTTVPLVLPRGLPKTDEFFGTSEVYRDAVEFEARSVGGTTAVLHWQGCADAGICYPPQTLRLALPATASRAASPAPAALPAPNVRTAAPRAAMAADADATLRGSNEALADATRASASGAPPTPGASASEQASAPSAIPAAVAPDPGQVPALAEDEALARRLAGSGLAVSIAVFFGLGLLLAFTPCTLPMVPIVSSLVVGGQPSPRRALLLSTAYVLPMALTYAALGVVAGLSGANLQAALQQPWLLGGFAVLFVVLALAMFGAFELQLPVWLRDRLDRAGRGTGGGTVAGAAAMGLLSALLVGPCMTAPLAGALIYIGQSGDPVTGGLALFALGLGMGLPLLLIALFGARVLPRPGPWMARVKAAFGFVLLALAVSMAGRVLPAAVTLSLWGAWLIMVAAGLLALGAESPAGVLGRWAPRALAAVAAVWAMALMLGGAAGGTDPLRPLEPIGGAPAAAATRPATPAYVHVKSNDDVARRIAEAGARGEWTLVDFYADWCVSCHVIEREVFADPAVAAALSRMQVLRPDVTANDATDQALMRAWQVIGPPTLLLIGPDGRERRALRTTGEIAPEAFFERLQRAGAGGHVMVSLGPIPLPLVLLVAALLVAVAVGRWAAPAHGDAPRLPVAGVFLDMLMVGLLAGRLVFVLQWWPLYAADPWSVLRPGDGGYSVWAGALAGLAFGAWRARRTPALRRPLVWGAAAGLASWAVLAGMLVVMQRAAVQLPTAELSRLEGGRVRLADMTGRPMVVNLWATWCPPCRREMPVLAQAQAANAGVQFVFVNQGEGEHTVRGYLREGGLQLRNVVLDASSAVSQQTGARGLPTTLFFAADGRLVDVHMGELTRAGLAQKLQRFGPEAANPSRSPDEVAR